MISSSDSKTYSHGYLYMYNTRTHMTTKHPQIGTYIYTYMHIYIMFSSSDSKWCAVPTRGTRDSQGSVMQVREIFSHRHVPPSTQSMASCSVCV